MGPGIERIGEWLRSEEVNLRRAGAETAGRIGWESVELVPDLARALQDGLREQGVILDEPRRVAL